MYTIYILRECVRIQAQLHVTTLYGQKALATLINVLKKSRLFDKNGCLLYKLSVKEVFLNFVVSVCNP